LKVILCGHDHSGTTVGGPDVWLRRLALYLIDHKLDITICYFYFGSLDQCNNIRESKKKGIHVETISFNTHAYTEDRVKAFLKIVNKLLPDLIIANLSVPVLFSARYLQPNNIPVIGVIHSNDEFYRGIIEEFIWKKSKYRIKYMVTVSDYLKDLCYQKVHKDAVKIETIPCGTIMPGMSNSKPNDIIRVVYVGRFRHLQKRIFDLTKAFCLAANQLEGFKFYFYGYGPDGEEKEMQIIIEQNNCKEKVMIKGLVDNNILHEELQDKHIVVLMSDFEGLPMALVEAMAVGLVPVCLKEESGVNEVVKHMQNGILLDNREDDFISALKYLQDNPHVWMSFSKKAKQTVLEFYAQEVVDQKWLNIIKSIINNKNEDKINDLKLPGKIKLPPKNSKISEDIRGPKPLPWYAVIRKRIGLRTRLKRFFKY